MARFLRPLFIVLAVTGFLGIVVGFIAEATMQMKPQTKFFTLGGAATAAAGLVGVYLIDRRRATPRTSQRWEWIVAFGCVTVLLVFQILMFVSWIVWIVSNWQQMPW